MIQVSKVWRVLMGLIAPVFLFACGGQSNNNDSSSSVSSHVAWDIECPTNFDPVSRDPNVSYFCVRRIADIVYFESHCEQGNTDDLFCDQMGEAYCPQTGEFDHCGGENNVPGPTPVIDLLHCPEGYGTPPFNGTYSYYCLGHLPPNDYYRQYCTSTSSDYFCALLQQDYCSTTDSILQAQDQCPSSSSPSLEKMGVLCPEGYPAPEATTTTEFHCSEYLLITDYFFRICGGEGFDEYPCSELVSEPEIVAWQCTDTQTYDPETNSCKDSPQEDQPVLCGVDYDALGNGSWQACYVLQNGTAECVHKENTTQAVQVKWDDGTPVQNAAQISGAGYYEVILITEEGTVHYGSRDRLSKNPKISELGISATGGQNTRCAMVRENNSNDIRCWDGNSDAYRPQLPNDFNAIQLSANYSDICALNDDGNVWCWEQKPDNSLDFISANPSMAPFSEAIEFVSVGQLQVCGVKASGGVECLARWDSTNYLPTKGSATNEPVNQSGMGDVIALELGFDQGITIHSDGKAKFWKSGSPTEFAGISNAIAAGGDRDLACVLTADRDIYCLNGSKQPVKMNGNVKARNSDCPLVF